MRDDGKADKQTDSDASPSGLGTRERWLAGLIGLAGVSVGGVGIFLSDNQAGTTAILLLGAVFLLMGVQGTAITKAGKDSVELERRREARKVLSEAVEAVEQEEPEQAAELVREAKSIDPSLASDPGVRYLNSQIYEREVYDAIRRQVGQLLGEGQLDASDVDFDPNVRYSDRQVDALITLRGGERTQQIAIEIKRTSTSPSNWSRRIREGVSQLRLIGLPGLLIVDALPSSQSSTLVGRLSSEEPAIELVRWRDSRDDMQLRAAVVRVSAPKD